MPETFFRYWLKREKGFKAKKHSEQAATEPDEAGDEVYEDPYSDRAEFLKKSYAAWESKMTSGGRRY
jgi:hypothetical protein